MYVKTLKIIIGVALIVIGIMGIFLPIIPGIIIILAGLFFLEIKIEDIKRWYKKLKF